MSRVTRAGIVALAMLSVLVLAACGDDGDSNGDSSSAANRSPTALVADTFGGSQAAKSGRLALGLKVDPKDAASASGPLSLALRGPFELGREGSLPKFDLDLAVDAGSTKISAGAISTGDRVWLEYGGTAFVLPPSVVKQLQDASKEAERRDAGGAKTTLASLGIDPRRWLTNPKIVGEETVGGDKVTHVRSDVDVAKLIDDLAVLTKKAGALGGSVLGSQTTAAPALSAKDRAAIEQALKRATVDIWTGVDDHALRRLRVVVDFDVPAEARSRAGDPTSGSLALDVAISDLNQPQTIDAPANARPFSELQPLLSGLLGG